MDERIDQYQSGRPKFPFIGRQIPRQDAGVAALPKARKRDGVPTATVFPCPCDLKPNLSEKGPDTLVRELITIFRVNGFAAHEMKIKLRVLNTYNLLVRAFEVHLDPGLDEIPKHAMTEASGVKIRPEFSVEAL